MILKSTFQHIRGISAKREYELWRSGVISWDAFERTQNKQISLFKDHPEDSIFSSSKRAFEAGDIDFFANQLNKQEHYRIALSFPEKVMFLDIETTGLSKYYDTITLIGWSIGKEYNVLIQGGDDSAFRKAISQAKIIVTFNGSLFDLPFIKKHFINVALPACHVDLRFLGKRAGLSGGQKEIEKKIGIKRHKSLQNIEGETAPVLWYKYCWGDQSALEKLIEYNHADIEGMKAIFDNVIHRLLKKHQAYLGKRAVSKFEKNRSKIRWTNSYLVNSDGIRVQPYKGNPGPLVLLRDLEVLSNNTELRVVGIDLTGSEVRPSGWCLLRNERAETKCLSSNDDIVAETLRAQPHLVSIDSPLSIPEGRISVHDDDPGRHQYGIMRYCERVLKKRGINVYPSLIPSMQRLTARGMRLASQFRSLGIPVIESYPGAAQDIMGIPRKRASLEYLSRGLDLFGIKGDYINQEVTHDELDAITSAVVGLFFWSGKFEALGNDAEEYLIIPDLKTNAADWKNRRVIGLSGPIASGKTTAGQMLTAQGFHYARYSQVLENILKERAIEVNRNSLQQLGDEIRKMQGQRWLDKKLFDSLPKSGNIVIDGLRHPEDHAFLMESFGPAFLHIHINSSNNVLHQRYVAERGNDEEFWSAIQQPVEANVSKLASLAHLVIRNASDMAPYEMELQKAINAASSKSRGEYHACL